MLYHRSRYSSAGIETIDQHQMASLHPHSPAGSCAPRPSLTSVRHFFSRLSLVLVCASAALISTLDGAISSYVSNHNTNNFTVFGYLPEYRLNNFDYENCFRLGVTHLIFFSLEVCSQRQTRTVLTVLGI
jgi:hypothetical protein